MNEQSIVPVESEDFDRAYSFPITAWGDFRIPSELKELVQKNNAHKALELGCGLGRFSRYLAKQGLAVTAVDFSPVAIAKARKKAENGRSKPDFITANVTNLGVIKDSFDVSFDVGCFHCLHETARYKYASEVCRLLKPGGIHLIWALDAAPGGIEMTPAVISETFKAGFQLQDSSASRRRIAKSHWYWLARK